MTLARNGTRKIVVGAESYRWVVSPDDGYLVLVVESADDPGQKVEAFFRYHDIHQLGAGEG